MWTLVIRQAVGGRLNLRKGPVWPEAEDYQRKEKEQLWGK